MAGFPPFIQQGVLNKVLPHVVVTLIPALSVTAPYMAKSQVMVTFDGDYTIQEGTATGIVNSPQPYVTATIVVSLLRSQYLAGLWLTQTQVGSVLGPVTIYPDSTAFPEVIIQNCSITGLDPGAYDGNDPTVKVTIKGIYPTNAGLWGGITL
jgi:hypothetical protein